MKFSPKTLAVLLGASVLLNVFFVGVLAARGFGRSPTPPGRFAAGPPLGGPRGPAERRLLRETVQLLGGPRSERVAPILAEHRRHRATFEREVRAAERAAREALFVVPPNPELFAAKLRDLATLEARGREHAHSALLRLTALLGDEERRKLAERLGREPAEP